MDLALVQLTLLSNGRRTHPLPITGMAIEGQRETEVTNEKTAVNELGHG